MLAIIAVALVSGYLPARKASRVDPLAALPHAVVTISTDARRKVNNAEYGLALRKLRPFLILRNVLLEHAVSGQGANVDRGEWADTVGRFF